ncbi:XrtA/PEP-CTERM system histidine kinase PrsK [Sulfuricaulis limicola]|uniref:XrtA/PEP-CTERM system histidine kinase PrsK n=1 Tax=Sulfuricaulis limicola TaxID=1620215 RepID=UPI0018D5062F|nr:XrtA/PEP-CTERM system histidine kinase PrsK [Sulfuricaulis limicola]
MISYLSAAGIFLVLLAVLLIGRADGSFKRLLALASTASALWAAAAAYQAAYGTPLIVPQLLELLRDFAWLTFLLHMLHVKLGEKGAMSTWLALVRHGLYAVTAVTTLFALYHHFSATGLSFLSGFDFQLAGHLTLAIAGLVLLEHILRNTPKDLMRAIKYLCFGVGGMFVYDFYLYSDALLFQRIDPALWEARGFINATVVPMVGIALARNPQWSPGVLVSRRIIFHTSALLGSGVYLLAMGVGGYYVRDYGGTWGIVAQTIFLFGAGLLLLILLFSGPLRARLRVFINKHFFHYKYDYREEWLRFIRTLSSNETDIPLPERAIRAIAQMIDSPGGVLWLRREQGHYEPEAKWNMEPPLSANEPAGSSLIRFLEIQKWVINLDEYRRDPGLYQSLGDLVMPSWLRTLTDAWLIAPLILQEKLHGFVVLARSPAVTRHFNWEDCDLLKTTGTQAASHLAQHAASQALAEARQFEAFNRLSTYVVHDLKNLISQLSLVVSNAARHRNNPLFMENVISTVENSVSKMNRLLARMREGAQTETRRMVNLAGLLEEVVREAQASTPAPVLECDTRDMAVTADRDRLASVMGHVIRNAQDATSEDGRVTVRLHKLNSHAVVEVEDTGCGMDEAFIRARLFRPFQTTKGDSGMGIGVYEAREFVRSLGGDIEVESKPGKGTIFRIRLPHQPALEPVRYQQNQH